MPYLNCPHLSVCRIVVHSVTAEQRDKPVMVIATDAKVLSLKYLDGRMFAGLKNGSLLIYSRTDGMYKNKLYLNFFRIFSYFYKVFWYFGFLMYFLMTLFICMYMGFVPEINIYSYVCGASG